MLPQPHLIWDGIAMRPVTADVAAQLVAEDKAQDLSAKFTAASELKHRSQFKGYQHAAEPVAKEPEPVKPKPTFQPAPVKAEETPIASKPVQTAPLKGWASYRGIVAKALDKPTNRVTKADVEAWLAAEEPDPLA